MKEYHTANGVKITDSDLINKDDFLLYMDGSNPHGVHPFVLHDHGFVICVVVAEHLQDALDEAFDAGKLDHFAITEDDMKDYDEDSGGVAFLGNASTACDIEGVSVEELSMPEFSMCKLLND